MKTPTFLEELAENLQHRYKKAQLSDLQLLFPNRRSTVFFLKALSEGQKKPLWAPGADSLEDFLFMQMGYERPEPIELLLLLYTLHKKICSEKNWPVQSFEDFSFWGTVILKDFAELDYTLLETKKVFTNIKALKDIEAQFTYLPEAHKTLAQRFWKHFLRTQTPHKEIFLRLWKELPLLYARLQKALQNRRQAYPGQLLRLLAEAPENYPQLTRKKLIFVGFYRLSAAEKKFIKYTLQQHQAEIHWDLDAFYIENQSHEAGHCFRSHQKDPILAPTLPHPLPKHIAAPKTISVQATPNPIAQVKSAAIYLHQYLKEHPKQPLERVAVILPREEMLLPLLHVLPKRELNISIGYPLLATPLRNLVLLFLSLWQQRTRGLPLPLWRKLLAHAYISPLCPTLPILWQKAPETTQRRIHPKNDLLYKYPNFLRKAFFEATHVLEGLQMLTHGLLEATAPQKEAQLAYDSDERPKKKEIFNRLERSYFESIEQMLTSLQAANLSGPLAELKPRSLEHLFENLLHLQRIPFRGEPLRGLQIMGARETRNLDFDLVIFLDMNEASWPPSTQHPTLLPQSLRHAYGLSTYSDQDADSVYIFYRLLHRSQRIQLFYIDPEGSSTPEIEKKQKSRLLYQLKYDNPHHQLQERPFTYRIHLKQIHPVQIEKSKALFDSWQKHSLRHAAPYALSVSDLNAYLSCPLRFYYQCILKIPPRPSAVAEESLQLGQFFHKIMHELYKPLKDRPLDEEKWKQTEKEAPGLLQRYLSQKYDTDPQTSLTGKARLMYELLLRYIQRVIKVDIQRNRKFKNLCIRHLEQKVSLQLPIQTSEGPKQIYLHGKCDRIDETPDTYFVLDYKTGKDKARPRSPAALFEPDPKGERSAQRQLALYAYMYHEQLKKRGRKKESQLLLLSLPSLNNPFPEAYTCNVEALQAPLKKCLEEIWDTSQPFAPAGAAGEPCLHCPYGNLCCR